MTASRLSARRLALLAVAGLYLTAGCYSSTPHRAQASTAVAQANCARTVSTVFANSGFIQVPPPPNVSMLFTPRIGGPYTSFLRTGAGVGVTLNQNAAPSCRVTIEALSPDSSCVFMGPPLLCSARTGPVAMDQVTGEMTPLHDGSLSIPACPATVQLCQLSYAPGEDNDAAVDELARRVQAALGAPVHVN
jgi:hypothetical protein